MEDLARSQSNEKYFSGRDITLTQDQFRHIFEASLTGMLLVDSNGAIVEINSRASRLFGYPAEELRGAQLEMLVPSRLRDSHSSLRAAFLSEPIARQMGVDGQLYGLRKDGTEVPVEIGLNPVYTSEGLFIVSSVSDISRRKQAETERDGLLSQLRTLNSELEARVRERTAELRSIVKEREVLLQEIHHRVKNNLQVISSLINMQMRKLEDAAGREALEQCQTRLQAIALIHENLYQAKDYSRIDFSAYARTLAANVFLAMGVGSGEIELEMKIEEVQLPVNRAIPCGLILNELMTNAIKHAFPDGRHGHIKVGLFKTSGTEVRLTVNDDGIGMVPERDVTTSESVGMQLVSTLAEQLDARLVISQDSGTSFHLTFSDGSSG